MQTVDKKDSVHPLPMHEASAPPHPNHAKGPDLAGTYRGVQKESDRFRGLRFLAAALKP